MIEPDEYSAFLVEGNPAIRSFGTLQVLRLLRSEQKNAKNYMKTFTMINSRNMQINSISVISGRLVVVLGYHFWSYTDPERPQESLHERIRIHKVIARTEFHFKRK